MRRSYYPGPEYTQNDGFAVERPGAKIHDGVDYAAPEGTDIRASADGKVVYSGNNDSGYGNTVILEHSDRLGSKVYSLYAHMKDGTPIKQDSTVKAGDKIGEVGHTGHHKGSNGGNHLHHEVLKPDGTDARGPYFYKGGTKYYLNHSGAGGQTGVPSNVGRRDPEKYNDYNEDAFGKGHPKYRPLIDAMDVKAMARLNLRNRTNPDSPQKPSSPDFPGGGKKARGGVGSSDGGTLERHGQEVFRIGPKGEQRGSFHSP